MTTRRHRWIYGIAGIAVVAGALWAWPMLDIDVRLRAPEALADSKSFWRDVPTSPRAVGDSFADLAQATSPAVVNISVERSAKLGQTPGSPEELFEEFFGRPMPRPERRAQAAGSGFVISEDGYIVTNFHVVDGADEIDVTLLDGRELEAKVIGRDRKTDLALLKVEGEDLPAVSLGDSDSVRVGDWVMAIGNPFGLDHTVTVGILSARGRNIGAGAYDDFLQTDASINPGNSGGPLLDMSGRVIGINTAINARAQGIGFAIPVNMAKDLLPQLREFGSVTRGWLGVQIQRVTPQLAQTFELDEPRGALVSQVFENSPAAKAKIQAGDVITRFNDREIKDFDDLPRLVAATAPGASVPIEVLRDGKRKELEVTLEKMDDEEEVELTQGAPSEERWGLALETLTPNVARQLELDQATEGVVITQVEPGSAAAEAELRRGDVVLEADRKKVKSDDELQKILKSAEKSVLLRVQRGESQIFVLMERPS
jgi:serine protease Do